MWYITWHMAACYTLIPLQCTNFLNHENLLKHKHCKLQLQHFSKNMQVSWEKMPLRFVYKRSCTNNCVKEQKVENGKILNDTINAGQK